MQELVYYASPQVFKLLVGGSMVALGVATIFIITMLIKGSKDNTAL